MHACQPKSQTGQNRLSNRRPNGSIDDALDGGADNFEYPGPTFSSETVGEALESLRPGDAVAIKEKSDEEGEAQLQGSLSHQSRPDYQELACRKQILTEVTDQFRIDDLIEEFCRVAGEPLPVFIQLGT